MCIRDRQKLNMRSLTESELVGVDDLMALIIWSRNFLKAQGYTIVDNILHQDNKSAILLEWNGRMSSGKRTKHIAVRYFFVTDRIKAGEISPKWCPTGEMIADFLTKPLQGRTFQKFRDLLMGTVPTVLPAQWYKDQLHRRSVLGDVCARIYSTLYGTNYILSKGTIFDLRGTPILSLLADNHLNQ